MCLFVGTGSNGAGSNNYAATASELSVPVGLAMDTTGNLYIAGYSYNQIPPMTNNHLHPSNKCFFINIPPTNR